MSTELEESLQELNWPVTVETITQTIDQLNDLVNNVSNNINEIDPDHIDALKNIFNTYTEALENLELENSSLKTESEITETEIAGKITEMRWVLTQLDYNIKKIENATSPESEEVNTPQDWDQNEWKFKKWISEKWQEFKNQSRASKRRLALTWLWWATAYWLFNKDAREKRRKKREDRAKYKRLSRAERKEAKRRAKEERRREIESRPFWQKPFWKFLKWLGIGWLVAWCTYWITKLLDAWGVNWADIFDNSNKQAKDTVDLKEKDPERYEKYKKFWENVDTFYNKIMEKEINAWWWGMSIADWYENYADKNNLDKDIFQATVPYCIDNEFINVSHFLSEWWYYASLRWLKFEELKDRILSWSKDKIGKVLWPFLTNLVSYIPYKWKDWKKWLEEWLSSWDREVELRLFFRQYAKVLNYTQVKQYSLQETIAKSKYRNVIEKNFSTPEDALRDEEFVEKYIYPDPNYKKFMDWKLHEAVDVMTDRWIFDSNLSADIESVIKAMDEERDEILNYKDGKDAIQRLNEFDGDKLPDVQCKECVKCCENIKKDISDNFDKSWTYMFFSWVQVAFNTLEPSMQEFLDISGLKALKDSFFVIMEDYKQKFASWEITKEEITLYKDRVNGYFAMKKEIEIWARSIQKMKWDHTSIGARVLNTSSAVVSDIYHQSEASIRHFRSGEYLKWWVESTIPLALWGTALFVLWKSKKWPKVEKAWKRFIKSNPFYTLYHEKWAFMRLWQKDLNRWPNWAVRARYDINHGDQLLLQDLIEWKISWDSATRVVQKWNKSRTNLKLKDQQARSISKFIQDMMWQAEWSMPWKYIEMLFNNDEGIVFMKNPSLRKMVFWEPSSNVWEHTTWRIKRSFRKKTYTTTGFTNSCEALEEFMLWVNGKSSICKSLSAEQKSFAKQLLENWNFKEIGDVKTFLSNIKNYDLKWFSDRRISNLVLEFIDHTDELGNMTKVQEKITKIRALPDVWGTLSDAAKLLDEDLSYVEKSIKEMFDNIDEIPIETKNRLNEIEEFKSAIKDMDAVEVDRLSTLLWKFKGTQWSLETAMEQLTAINRLKWKSITILELSWSTKTYNFDDILKNLDNFDINEIRRFKGKNLWVSDELIDSLATTLKTISDTNAQKMIGSSDEIFEAIWKLAKYLAALT